MKIFISADIEGVTGTTDWDDVTKKSADYPEFQKQMTLEVKAACEGAMDAGAREIVVKDAHSTAKNLIAGMLPREATLVRGWSRHPYLMMQELDRSFDAVLMIGYHSGAGSNLNPLAHTISASRIYSITINGKKASEFLINCYTSALEAVPVTFISGDRGICDEAGEMIPGITTVAVKEGFGASTLNIHPAVAGDRIREGVKHALKQDLSACTHDLPERFEIEVEYTNVREAYRCSFYPGAVLASPSTIRFVSTEFFEILRLLMFVI